MITMPATYDTLDTEGLQRVIERIRGRTGRLFVLGTTGKAQPELPPAANWRPGARLPARVPVLVGVTDMRLSSRSTLPTMRRGRAPTRLSSRALLFAPSQEDLWQYVRRLVAEMPLPVFLYNMPTTPRCPSLETVRRALDVPEIVGIKDVGRHDLLRPPRNIVAERPDFTPDRSEELWRKQSCSALTAASAGANLCPQLYVDPTTRLLPAT